MTRRVGLRVVSYLRPEREVQSLVFGTQTQLQSSSEGAFEKTEKEREMERLLARGKADLREKKKCSDLICLFGVVRNSADSSRSLQGDGARSLDSGTVIGVLITQQGAPVAPVPFVTRGRRPEEIYS